MHNQSLSCKLHGAFSFYFLFLMSAIQFLCCWFGEFDTESTNYPKVKIVNLDISSTIRSLITFLKFMNKIVVKNPNFNFNSFVLLWAQISLPPFPHSHPIHP